MPDQMLEPHYLKVWVRGRGWTPATDGRGPRDGTHLPIKFKDWFAANHEATKGDIGQHNQVQIFPYYPEYADRERAYVASLIAKEEASFERETMRHEERLGALIAERDAVPV